MNTLFIKNIRIPVPEIGDDIEQTRVILKNLASRKIKVPEEQITSFKIEKESIDARQNRITFVYSVTAGIAGPLPPGLDDDCMLLEEKKEPPLIMGAEHLSARPVVIGSGPAGLFAALTLAQKGYRPLVLERGAAVEERIKQVKSYWDGGQLHSETNVQFGEGGAGTFSDGKLTTRVHDPRCDKVLALFHSLGAPGDILYKSKPHVGSDNLIKIVKNIRRTLLELGAEIRFNCKAETLDIKAGSVTGVRTSEGPVAAGAVILAIGHSARDTFARLFTEGVIFVPKSFSIGARIEHPQELINRARYGSYWQHPRLGAAEYQLFHKKSRHTAYTFCMCPGGLVAASASEPETIVTNGMSYYKRSLPNANSAFVVAVDPADFGSAHPLAGIDFQRTWEQLAYKAGGAGGSAPVQRLEDFLKGRASRKTGAVEPSYTGTVQPADLNSCLPAFVTDSMKASTAYFESKLKGFALKDAVLTGVETRTSSPVRIPRGEDFTAEGIKGLYPAGEGAGYAGGIVSAAIDGIRCAEQLMARYCPAD